MGGRGSGGVRNRNSLTEAIQAYTAKGGELSSKHPFTREKRDLLFKEMSDNTYVTTKDIYRKIDLTQSQYEAFFNELYEKGEKSVDFNELQSFTENRTRAFSYGGTQQQYILYKIPKGTSVHGDNISDRSVYSIEQEVLLGANNFTAKYSELDWTSSNNMIVTLKPRRKR